MPMRAPSHGALVRERGAAQRRYDAQGRYREERRVYKTARWLRLRERVLGEEPLCRDPYGWHAASGRVAPSVDVDHIIPLRVNLALAYVRTNLQGLCRHCHRRKTIEDLKKT